MPFQLFELPATGPLSTPLLKSYIRKQVISIRLHYKEMYFSCVGASLDGVLSFSVVYSLIKRSGGNINTFNVLSYIILTTDTGKHPIPRKRLYIMFSGVVPGITLKKILTYLKKIQFIRLYTQPTPTGPEKYISLTPAGKQYYKDFSRALENHFLKPLEAANMPPVRTGTTSNRLPRLNHTTRL